MVIIGIDPHKGSHTAVAIDGDEVVRRGHGPIRPEPARAIARNACFVG